MSIRERVEETFAAIAGRTSAAAGSFWAFAIAVGVVQDDARTATRS